MIERDGNIIANVVEDTTMATINAIVSKNIKEGSEVMTDEWKGYNGLKKHYSHSIVNHSAKEYVNGKAYTNTFECFWSHLKRGIDGIYHWASVKHLQAYVEEYTLRSNTRKSTTCNRFNLVLANSEGRLTYKGLIYNPTEK